MCVSLSAYFYITYAGPCWLHTCSAMLPIVRAQMPALFYLVSLFFLGMDAANACMSF